MLSASVADVEGFITNLSAANGKVQLVLVGPCDSSKTRVSPVFQVSSVVEDKNR
jgi:hypothetical protein